MAVTLDDVKLFLRVDYNDDDTLIEKLMVDATNRCMDILRVDENDRATLDTSSISNFDLAVMFCVAYTFENREECDYKKLNLSLRGLLFGDRESKF